MAELSEKLEIIDRKTYETPLTIKRGLFHRRQLPVTIEARQIKPVNILSSAQQHLEQLVLFLSLMAP